MKIFQRNLETMKWEPLEQLQPNSTLRILLRDDQVLEISEEHSGLFYLAVRTPTGILAIYPESANKIKFRVVPD